MPSVYANEVADMVDAVSADLGWWEIINDDRVLKSLVLDAIEKNHDLHLAVSRMRQARELADINTMAPTVKADVDSTRRQVRFSDSGEQVTSNGFGVGISVGWELDLWGKVRHGKESALAQFLASEHGRRAVFLALVSNMVSGYYQLQSLDMKLDTARRTVVNRKRSLEIAQKRWDCGVADMLEVNQAKSALAQVEATIPPLELAVHQQENQLNLLLGRMPCAVPRGTPLRNVPPKVIAPGIPSELLERRPDIRQREELLRAANAQVGIATANLFPSFSLTGALGLQSQTLLGFAHSQTVWSVGGGLLAPIFNGGALRHQRNASVEGWEQAKIEYEKTVIAAMCEVSNALVSVAKAKETVKAQEKVVNTLRDAERIAVKRFEYGVSPYLEILDAQRQLFSAELSFAEALCDQQSNVIKLYLALGGGWKQAERPKGNA